MKVVSSLTGRNAILTRRLDMRRWRRFIN